MSDLVQKIKDHIATEASASDVLSGYAEHLLNQLASALGVCEDPEH